MSSPCRGLRHAGREQDDRRDAAEVGEVALEHVERDAAGDAGIDRVAAALEHADAGGGREVVARAHHVPLGEDRGPALTDRDRRRGVLDRDLAHGTSIGSNT